MYAHVYVDGAWRNHMTSNCTRVMHNNKFSGQYMWWDTCAYDISMYIYVQEHVMIAPWTKVCIQSWWSQLNVIRSLWYEVNNRSEEIYNIPTGTIDIYMSSTISGRVCLNATFIWKADDLQKTRKAFNLTFKVVL